MPSPRPLEIVELEVVRSLAAAGTVVIAGGGGGLPVYRDEAGDLQGLEAVIDKDHASSLLARRLGAERLVISTAVDRVALDFGRPTERWIDRMTVSEARGHAAEGHFAAGSMGPKVAALVDYVEATGHEGLVTDPPHLDRALAGEAGTRIVPDESP